MSRPLSGGWASNENVNQYIINETPPLSLSRLGWIVYMENNILIENRSCLSPSNWGITLRRETATPVSSTCVTPTPTRTRATPWGSARRSLTAGSSGSGRAEMAEMESASDTTTGDKWPGASAPAPGEASSLSLWRESAELNQCYVGKFVGLDWNWVKALFEQFRTLLRVFWL